MKKLLKMFARTPVTAAERDAIMAVLPNATPIEVERIVLAVRSGNARRVQDEIVEAGLPLSAAPPLGFEIRRRLAALVVMLIAMVGCGGTPEPSPPEPEPQGEAGASTTVPSTKPTEEQLASWCVQTESDRTCAAEASSACRAGEATYMNVGCTCDPLHCERPAAFATTGFPGFCCRAPE